MKPDHSWSETGATSQTSAPLDLRIHRNCHSLYSAIMDRGRITLDREHDDGVGIQYSQDGCVHFSCVPGIGDDSVSSALELLRGDLGEASYFNVGLGPDLHVSVRGHDHRDYLSKLSSLESAILQVRELTPSIQIENRRVVIQEISDVSAVHDFEWSTDSQLRQHWRLCISDVLRGRRRYISNRDRCFGSLEEIVEQVPQESGRIASSDSLSIPPVALVSGHVMAEILRRSWIGTIDIALRGAISSDIDLDFDSGIGRPGARQFDDLGMPIKSVPILRSGNLATEFNDGRQLLQTILVPLRQHYRVASTGSAAGIRLQNLSSASSADNPINRSHEWVIDGIGSIGGLGDSSRLVLTGRVDHGDDVYRPLPQELEISLQSLLHSIIYLQGDLAHSVGVVSASSQSAAIVTTGLNWVSES